MKERPILFSAPMVRALLDGTKTQTRRILKPQPIAGVNGWDWSWPIPGKNVTPGARDYWRNDAKNPLSSHYCPYGQPGDQIWVRETFCPIYPQDSNYNGGRPIEFDYAATYRHGDRLGDDIGIKKAWKPSIHMPRAASRINLAVTGVRVERLQDISEADARAEGAECLVFDNCTDRDRAFFDMPLMEDGHPYRNGYALLWESLNGAGSWDANPWVWVVEFKRVM